MKILILYYVECILFGVGIGKNSTYNLADRFLPAETLIRSYRSMSRNNDKEKSIESTPMKLSGRDENSFITPSHVFARFYSIKMKDNDSAKNIKVDLPLTKTHDLPTTSSQVLSLHGTNEDNSEGNMNNTSIISFKELISDDNVTNAGENYTKKGNNKWIEGIFDNVTIPSQNYGVPTDTNITRIETRRRKEMKNESTTTSFGRNIQEPSSIISSQQTINHTEINYNHTEVRHNYTDEVIFKKELRRLINDIFGSRAVKNSQVIEKNRPFMTSNIIVNNYITIKDKTKFQDENNSSTTDSNANDVNPISRNPAGTTNVPTSENTLISTKSVLTNPLLSTNITENPQTLSVVILLHSSLNKTQTTNNSIEIIKPEMSLILTITLIVFNFR